MNFLSYFFYKFFHISFMVVKDTKVSQKIKNKSWLNISSLSLESLLGRQNQQSSRYENLFHSALNQQSS